MSLKLMIEAGGEYLLPFARKKLADLKAEMKRFGLPMASRWFQVSDSEKIFLQSQFVGLGQFLDTIRINSGSVWDFSASTAVSSITTAYLYYLGKNAPKAIQIDSFSLISAVKSFRLPFRALIPSSGQLKDINPSGNVVAFGRNDLADVYSQSSIAAYSASAKRLGYIMGTADNLNYVLTDGVSERAFDNIDGTGLPTVLATRDDLFSWQFVSGTGVRIVSLASGILADVVTALTQQLTPVCNYYDIFYSIATASGTDFYIGASLVYSTADTLGGRHQIKATKDCFFIIHDSSGALSGENTAAAGVTETLTIHKFLRDPNTETYAHTTQTFDVTMDVDGQGYFSAEVSASECYVWVRYRIDLGGPTDPTTYFRIMSGSGIDTLYASLDSSMISDSRDGEIVTSIAFSDHCQFLAKFQNSGFSNIQELRFVKSDGTGVNFSTAATTFSNIAASGTGAAAFAVVNESGVYYLIGADGSKLNLTALLTGLFSVGPVFLVSTKSRVYVLIHYFDTGSVLHLVHITDGGELFEYEYKNFNSAYPASSQILRMQELDAWAA